MRGIPGWTVIQGPLGATGDLWFLIELYYTFRDVGYYYDIGYWILAIRRWIPW